MSNRLDQDREKRLEPKRIESAKINIGQKLGLDILEVTDKHIKFEFQNEVVTFFPYSGWHTGKSITDGRGWKNLYNQLTCGWQFCKRPKEYQSKFCDQHTH